MWIVLRARDEASGTLRRAARGIGNMKDTGDLQRQRDQIANQIKTAERLEKDARVRQITNAQGSRRTQQLIQESRYEKRSLDLVTAAKGIESERHSILQRRLALQVKLSQDERLSQIRKAATIPPEGVLRGKTQAELNKSILSSKAGIEATDAAFLKNTGRLLANAKAVETLSLEISQLIQKEVELEAAAISAGEAAQEQAEKQRILRTRLADIDKKIADTPTNNLKEAARSASNLGRSMALVGGAGVVAFGLMAHSAANFATEATTAATQTGKIGSGADVIIRNSKRIQSALISQMKQFPSSSQDMNKAIYDIYSSMNISFGKGLQLLKIFNEGVIAAGGPSVLSLTDLSTALITLANNWKININDMGAWRRIMASTLATVRFGRLTVQQYTMTMNQLAPAFRGAHLSIQQMNAAIAFQTRLQPSQRFAATGIARLVQQLQRIAPALRNNFGVDITNARGNLLNLDVVFGKLIKRFPQLLSSGTSLTTFFKDVGGNLGTIQAQRAFSAFIRNFGLYKSVLKSTSGDQNEFNRSLAAMRQTGGIQWAVFINQLKAVALEVGSYVLPIFIKLGRGISFLIGMFDKLPEPVKRMVAVFTASLAIFTLFSGLLLGLAGAVGGGILALEGLAEGFELVTGAVDLTAASMVALEAIGLLTQPEIFVPLLAIGAVIVIFAKWHKSIIQAVRDHDVLRAALMNFTPIRVVIVIVNLIKQMFDLAKAFANFVGALMNAASHIKNLAIKLPGLSTAIDGVSRAVQKLAHWWHIVAGLPPIKLAIDAGSAATGHGGGHGFLGVAGRITGDILNPIKGTIDALKLITKGINDALKDTDKALGKKPAPSAFFDIHQQQIERFQYEQSRRNRGLNPLTFTDDAYFAEIRKLQRLKKASEEAPNLKAKYAALRAYQLELGRAMTKETDVQKKFQEELLGSDFGAGSTSAKRAIADFMKLRQLQAQFAVVPTMGMAKAIQKLEDEIGKASPAVQKFLDQLSQTMAPVKLISDNRAIALAMQAARLKKAFDNAPSTAAWARWYAVQHQFTTLATSDQQQLADDMVNANQQAVEKMKQNFDSLLQNVRSMYDSIHSELVTQFGSLGSGPVISGLSDKVKAITDAAKTKADKLRAEADSLKKAEENASKVDAKTGNLIDKGFLPNPDDLKNANDKAINDLNDQAKRIEDAAQKTADKLQARIDAKKFTPKEILNDLRAQRRAFRDWNNDLESIRKRGGSQELVDQLRGLGPDFDNMLKGILRMTPKQFAEYKRQFAGSQADINKQTMRLLRAQLKLYRKHGMDIAQAIADGLKANDKAIKRSLILLIEETFPGVKVPKSERVPVPSVKTQNPQHGGRQHDQKTVVNYNYYAGEKGMSPQTYFQKMHFRQRNQRRC